MPVRGFYLLFYCPLVFVSHQESNSNNDVCAKFSAFSILDGAGFIGLGQVG